MNEESKNNEATLEQKISKALEETGLEVDKIQTVSYEGDNFERPIFTITAHKK